jgi:Tol biopolymer transport system component
MHLWKIVGPALFSLLLVGCQDPTVPTLFQQSYLHIQPGWSKDGRTIAFSATYNNVSGLYLVDSSGSNVRLLYAGIPQGCAWSPDSKSLVFMENYNLYEIDVSGDSALPLTSYGADMFPSWSPDGGKIAFSRDGLGIYLYSLQTAQSTGVFQAGDYPSWHPDGELVALGQTGSGENGNVYVFYALSADSLHWRTLLTFLAPGICGYASVSPAGLTEQEIVFSLSPSAGYTQIWKVSVASGAMTQLTSDGGDFPAWSPDGSKIVYTRTQKGDGGLWIMNADGSGKHRLTTPGT